MTDKVQKFLLSNTIKPLNISNGSGKNGQNINNYDNWTRWKEKFLIYYDAHDFDDLTEKKKVALFLNSIGEDGIDIFNSFGLDRTIVKLDDVIKKFDEKFNPCKNTTVERYKFFTRYQKDDESLDEYCTTLNNLSKSCDLSSLKESLVKDMFVIGIRNKYIKERLLQENFNDINEAIQFSKNLELSQERSSQLPATDKEKNIHQDFKEINSINHEKMSRPRRPLIRSSHQERPRSISRNSSTTRNKNYSSNNSFSRNHFSGQNMKNCGKCGQIHRHKCPALGKICIHCKKPNHFAKMCRSNTNKRLPVNSAVRCINNDFIINSIESKNLNNWSMNIYIFDYCIPCQIDTGADVNVISESTLYKIKQNRNINIPIRKTNNRIFTFSGQLIENIGSVKLYCQLENQTNAYIYFIVVKDKCKTIIGWRTSEKLGIVKRLFQLTNGLHEHETSIANIDNNNKPRSVQHIINKYSNTFEGLGCLPTEVHLEVDESIKPKICPVRRIPYALHDKLKEELDRMEKLKVIEKINEPTEWVNSFVPVEKPNKTLRLCLDPRNLNKAIKRPLYPYPTFDDLRSKVSGASVFSKLDANSGYWMLKLDNDSSKLTTFNTQFGRYKFLRLPYGINSSGEIFHRVMNDIFQDLPGVILFVDDILVYGSTQKIHDENLERLFKKAQEVNLKFNKSKCQFSLPQISYVGHIFDRHGISPDKSKIEAIIEMPKPKDIKELQRFLGMVNYLGSYIPNLSEETSILRDLLKKKNVWQWTENHDQQFNKLKSLICQSPTLIHYDVKKPVRMSVDASKNAVGAVIFHEKHPIAYASKSLNKSQEHYAQIEKELFAIVFGCKKFHQYIYGKTIQVETDHQPLVTLFKKSLSDVPARLQRMMIAIQSYDLIVSYVKGSEMYVSDTLSRAPINKTEIDETDFNELYSNIECQVNLLTSNLSISKEKLEKIISHSLSDISFKKIIEYFKEGWPKSRQHCDPIVLPYWNIRDEIHVVNNILFKNNSVIIPKSLRPSILSELHESHMGIEKTKNLARGLVYWPNINQDIETHVSKCESCMMYRPNKTKESILFHEQPNLPWQKVATDLFDYKNKKYLVVVDFYSNYIELAYLNNNSTSNSVIFQLKSIFARHGIPVQLVSDGGPPFNSKDFKNFLKEWDVEHITSSPHFPRSNGLAEVSVKIIKNIFRKCEESGSDYFTGLLHYRTTSKTDGNKSPAELLMSRKLRTKIPTNTKNLKPKVVRFSEYIDNKVSKQLKTSLYYNRNCKPSQVFEEGQSILFKKNPKDIIWTKGIIMSKTNLPRSYLVKDQNNVIYRRTSQHILNCNTNRSRYNQVNNKKRSSLTNNHYNNRYSQNYSHKYQSNCMSTKTNNSFLEKDDYSSSDDEQYSTLSYYVTKGNANDKSPSQTSIHSTNQSEPEVFQSLENSPINDNVQTESELENHSNVLSPEFIEMENVSEDEFLPELSDQNSNVLPEMQDISFSAPCPEAKYTRRGRKINMPDRFNL